MGDLEIVQVDGEVDRRQAAGVFPVDVGAGENASLDRFHVARAYGQEQGLRFRGQLGGDPVQRDVDGRRHHAQLGASQHHHDVSPAGERGEVLGMAGVGEARSVLQRLLVDRRGADRGRRARRGHLQ